MAVSYQRKFLFGVSFVFVALFFLVLVLNQNSKRAGEILGSTGYQSESQYKKWKQSFTEFRDTASYKDRDVKATFENIRIQGSANDTKTLLKGNSIRIAGDISESQSRGRYNFLDLNCVSTIPDQLVGVVEDMPILIPDSLAFPPEVLACLYHRYVTTKQIGCVEPKLFGNAHNRGGYICVDEGILSKGNCEAYIFNHAVDERYKKQLNKQYKCTINTMEDANEDLFLETSSKSFLLPTLRNWILSQRNSHKAIDLVVIELSADINEIYSMNELLQATHLMSRIKQISFRIYLTPKSASSLDYIQRLLIFKKLYELNFRIFHFNQDWPCAPENIRKNKFSSCYSVYMMRPSKKDPVILTLPSDGKIRAMDNTERHRIFNRFLSSNQVLCRQNIRVGNVISGGWNICHDPVYRPSYPCLVYSFGIKDDSTFDEDMEATYGCEVHSFDPSINRTSYRYSDKVHFHNIGIDGVNHVNAKGWDLRTLDSIMKMLGHSGRTIDILKIDVEGSEWPALKRMFEVGTLQNVRQLNMEYHRREYMNMMSIMRKLHDLGFRIHWTSMNLACSFMLDDGFTTACYEVYYIRVSNHSTDIN